MELGREADACTLARSQVNVIRGADCVHLIWRWHDISRPQRAHKLLEACASCDEMFPELGGAAEFLQHVQAERHHSADLATLEAHVPPRM